MISLFPLLCRTLLLSLSEWEPVSHQFLLWRDPSAPTRAQDDDDDDDDDDAFYLFLQKQKIAYRYYIPILVQHGTSAQTPPRSGNPTRPPSPAHTGTHAGDALRQLTMHISTNCMYVCACVCITAGPIIKLRDQTGSRSRLRPSRHHDRFASSSQPQQNGSLTPSRLRRACAHCCAAQD